MTSRGYKVVSIICMVMTVVVIVLFVVFYSKYQRELAAEKSNYRKYDAVNIAKEQVLVARKKREDSLKAVIKEYDAEYGVILSEYEDIKDKYKNLKDEINTVNNLDRHMFLGDSLITANQRCKLSDISVGAK